MIEQLEIMTTNEVVEYLRTTKTTLFKLIREGVIPAVKVGKAYRFRRSEIEAFLSGKPSPAAKPKNYTIDSKEAARILGCHEGRILNLAVSGRLPKKISDTGDWLFDPSDLERFRE